MSPIWIVFALASGIGALMVGLIGFGSSLVILPVLLVSFPTMFAPEIAVRLAAGTTMATMAVSALAAGASQARSKQVCWPLLRLAALPYLLGALIGPWLAKYLPVTALRLYAAGILILLGIMVLRRPATSPTGREWHAHQLEIRAMLFGIGLCSSVAGIASGMFAIPYLSRFSLPLREVIGTSTVAAAIYSLFGTLGYISAGLGTENPPAWSLGFVYLPAFAIMSVVGVVTGPLGVRLAGSLSETVLRRVLTIFFFGAATVIAWS